MAKLPIVFPDIEAMQLNDGNEVPLLLCMFACTLSTGHELRSCRGHLQESGRRTSRTLPAMPEQEQNAHLRRQLQEQSNEIAALKVLC